MKQLRKRTRNLEADYALSLQPGEGDDIDALRRRWFWTGWKRRHWPANVVRPGVFIYGFDTRLDNRRLTVLLRVIRGRSFSYTSKRTFSEAVRRISGWSPGRDDPHWHRIPVSRTGRPCTGLALRWEVVKRADIPLAIRFPRLGWLKLADSIVFPSLELDAADLYREGDRILREHLAIERNAQLRADSKSYWRAKMGGHLTCHVCTFDFGTTYGKEWIEMHHIDPLGTTKRKRVTDLVPVCSNCHRMIHLDPRRPKSLKELRTIIRRQARQRSRENRRAKRWPPSHDR